MSCIVYTMSCNFTTHVTYLLTFMTYKYSELEVFSATQQLNCKGSYEIPLFHNVIFKQ
jgi:hypothetical protein